MSLARFTTRAVGTVATALNTAVPVGKSWTVIGLSFCNKTASTVSVQFYVSDSVPNNTFILYNFNIPAGETLFPYGLLGKGVMLAGDVFWLSASVAAAIDVVMPYYQEAA